MGRGWGAKKDGPGGMTWPMRGWHLTKNIFVTEFRKNAEYTTSEGGSGEETTAKKVITLQRAMTKKVVSFLGRKRWHHQLPPRVTSILVTPLIIDSRQKSLHSAEAIETTNNASYSNNQREAFYRCEVPNSVPAIRGVFGVKAAVLSLVKRRACSLSLLKTQLGNA